VKYNPTTLDIVLDDKCNLSCKGCIKQTFKNGTAVIDYNTFIDTIENFSDKAISNVHFTGGEPLLKIERINDIIEQHRLNNSTSKPEFSIYSNLKILTDETIKFLKSNRIIIHTSIDGLEAENDLIRGCGSWRDTVNNIQRLKNNNVYLQSITTTLKNENFHAINNEFVSFICDMNVPVWRINIDYWGVNFDPDEVTKKVFDLFQFAKSMKLRVEGTWMYPFNNMLSNRKEGFCPALKGDILALLPNGSISLCPYSKANIGSFKDNLEVLSQKYEEIKIKHSLFNFNKCQGCFINMYCKNHCMITRESGSKQLNEWYCQIYRNLTYLLLQNHINQNKMNNNFVNNLNSQCHLK
jgi:radical SAM protein with 4Fe4S-binding SPASM domain